ncbi:MAG: preprotein translocase subunit SecE [Oscillospiraceae bacterium]
MADKLTKNVKTDKPVKSKEKKVGFASKIVRFFRDLKGEFKKIVWSSKKQVINNTIVVIVFMVIVAIFIFALDSVLGFLTKLIYGLAK